MNIWSVLGIEETRDKELLKTAYREKLKSVNPEDDQQGFMRLREAYEEALKLADYDDLEDSLDFESNDELPFPVKDELKDIYFELDDLYKDYQRRIDEENWIEIFNRDEFVSLDSSSDAFEMLIRFLMINFLLPHNIWKIVVDTFDIKKRKSELSEKYPKDFLDFVIDNSENIDIFNYYLFDFDVDNEKVDEFIKKYLTMNTAIRRNDLDEAKGFMEELEDMDLYHPYIELSKIRIKLHEEDALNHDDLYEKAKVLYDECPDDFNVTSLCGDLALMKKKTEDAKIYYDELKAMEPDSFAVKVKFADLSYFQGDYEASRDAYMELLRENNYDNNIRAGLLRANLSLIEENKKKLLDEPDNAGIKIELAWSYYQSYKFEDAVNVLEDFLPDAEKSFEYYNVKGRAYLCLLDYKNAFNCFYRWKEAIESLPKDVDDEDIRKKRKRLPYVNFLIGDCYLKLKKYDKAELLINMALSVPHDEIVLSYEALCELKYETEQYGECIKACEKLLDYGENNYVAYNYMAKSCFKLNYIKEAVDACENAINVYPYAADPYALEVDIFLEIGQIDTAYKIIERYKQFDFESDQIELKRAQILIKEDKIDIAYNVLIDIFINSKKRESDLESFEEVYSLVALCCENLGRPNQALRYLNKLLEINPNHKTAYGRKGLIQKAGKQYKQALINFDKQIQINPHPYFYYQKATVYRKLKEYDKAIEYYRKAAKGEKDNAYIYKELAYLYEYLRQYENVIHAVDKALYTVSDNSVLAEFYIIKGRNLQTLLRYGEAKALYEEYKEKIGIDYDYIYDYSVLLQRTNKIDEAVNLIKDNLIYIKEEKDEISLLRQLCSIYGDEGYINLANETFRIIISKSPDDVEAYSIMGDNFRENGLYNEAIDCYLNAIRLDFN
ncbi:MAG: tetratricopeptide repeat protein [Lachnospiraceae bacterium]|nr:tetratricopeptide repeat protein [Lachnospiraceae bacterium]